MNNFDTEFKIINEKIAAKKKALSEALRLAIVRNDKQKTRELIRRGAVVEQSHGVIIDLVPKHRDNTRNI